MSAIQVSAAGSASFKLEANPWLVRIGDTVTVTGRLSTSEGVATFDLNVSYPAANLQYVKTEGLPQIKSGELDINASSGKIQLLYLDADGGGSPLTSGSIFKITFKVIGGSTDDPVPVNISVKTVGNADAESMGISSQGVTMTIAAPLSTNNFLGNLGVNGTLFTSIFKNHNQLQHVCTL